MRICGLQIGKVRATEEAIELLRDWKKIMMMMMIEEEEEEEEEVLVRLR